MRANRLISHVVYLRLKSVFNAVDRQSFIADLISLVTPITVYKLLYVNYIVISL